MALIYKFKPMKTVLLAFTIILSLTFSLMGFSQNAKKDTVYLPSIQINDSLPITFAKVDISDSIDSWEELVLVQELVNETAYPIIITRVSTGSGGMVPQTSASRLDPCLPSEKTTLYYKYLRAGNTVHKTINFTFNFYNSQSKFQTVIINRAIIKKNKTD